MPANRADVFWYPNGCCKSLAVYARERGHPGFGSVVSLELWPCRKALIKTVCGLQMLVLSDAYMRVQVRFAGSDIRLQPFALEPVIENFPKIRSSTQLIDVLAELYGAARPSPHSPIWSVESTRHRDALMALDLRLAGHSYREIAIELYGQSTVDADWNDPNLTMKNRLIRSVKRGQAMMNGGYRALFK